MGTTRRAIWFAAVVSVFVLGVAGSVLAMHGASSSEPTRIRDVRDAAAAISTGGVVDATDGMLWCSANQ